MATRRQACGQCGRPLSAGACARHPGAELLDLTHPADEEHAAALQSMRRHRWVRLGTFAGVAAAQLLALNALYDGASHRLPVLFEGGPGLWVLPVAVATVVAGALVVARVRTLRQDQARAARAEATTPAATSTAPRAPVAVAASPAAEPDQSERGQSEPAPVRRPVRARDRSP